MRLIDANALKKEMLETYEYEYPTASGAFDEFASRIVPNIISNAPTIDALPVRHGHWIEYEDNKRECYCSECDFPAGLDDYGYHNMQDPYCRFCGAKMDEVSEC